jgi:hypothetical protein
MHRGRAALVGAQSPLDASNTINKDQLLRQHRLAGRLGCQFSGVTSTSRATASSKAGSWTSSGSSVPYSTCQGSSRSANRQRLPSHSALPPCHQEATYPASFLMGRMRVSYRDTRAFKPGGNRRADRGGDSGGRGAKPRGRSASEPGETAPHEGATYASRADGTLETGKMQFWGS